MTQDSRRKLLQGLLVTLPTVWARPVVDSVALPVHAEQSPAPPPVRTTESCGIVACGGGPAFTVIPLTNVSANAMTLVDIEFSNPNHSVEAPLPLVLDPAECLPLSILDSANTCGNDVDPGVVTLFFDGFAPLDVNVPVSGFGP